MLKEATFDLQVNDIMDILLVNVATISTIATGEWKCHMNLNRLFPTVKLCAEFAVCSVVHDDSGNDISLLIG